MDTKVKDLDLTLEPELKEDAFLISEAPALKPLTQEQQANLGPEFNAGTIDMSMFSEEEQAQIDAFAQKIDIENVEQIVKYGSDAQKNISDFSVNILQQVKTRDLGEVGDSLKELTVALDSVGDEEKKGIKGLFQKAQKNAEAVKAGYSKAETNVNKIEKDLIGHRAVLGQDIQTYQQMYELNVDYYRQLTKYIIAGKKALYDARNGKLQELGARAQETGREEDAQAFKDYEELCYRFEKKLADLEITRVISIQTSIQVRMLQNNDRELMDKLQSSLANTIPLWRNQLVLTLGIENTRKALAAQTLVSEKTNELLAKNAETLKMASIGTAQESERPIVDLETLQKCNSDLITSITEVVRIHEEGSAKRAAAQQELTRMEGELKQALMNTIKR